MKKNKVVIFDFDGVIVDSLMAAYTTWTEAGATLSLDEYTARFNGNINDAYEPAQIDFFKEYEHKVKDLKIFPGIADAVRELENKYHLPIMSSSSTKESSISIWVCSNCRSALKSSSRKQRASWK